MTLITFFSCLILAGGVVAGLVFPPVVAAHVNRLIHEKSPYLLQHADNPVDWFPWGPEAFAKAKTEGKLIFLSIGYSTCHWCHVMEKESFEDEEVAAVLNADFVAIKVDREERPDIDAVYMAAAQMLSGGGGWPLNLLLTPDRKPIFAGTYLPKHTKNGRVGLIELLERAQGMWETDPTKLRDHGSAVAAELARATAAADPTDPDPAVFATAASALGARFDGEFGGFGSAPKFPSPHNLVFLLRRYRRTGEANLLRMVETTLGAMRRGGIYDQIGYGFHRYSTDGRWLVPHFEKMLYDQAGLAVAYLEAYQVTGRETYAETAREVLTYVLRDMADPGGGFYSAEDADSEGLEGKFYLWTPAELSQILGAEDAALVARTYGVTKDGNFPEVPGATILHLQEPLSNRSPAERIRLEAARVKLLERRAERVRPGRDDKVLAAWNGMMISALARGGWVLEDRGYTGAAVRAAGFAWTTLRPEGKLHRRYRTGEVAVEAVAEDFAFLSRGFLDLYRATFDPVWLERARTLAGELFERFGADDGGLYDTPDDGEALLIRPRNAYDGAHPSAASIALEVAARLALLTGDPSWLERADRLARALTAEVARAPSAHTAFLQGLALVLEPTREVVIVGADDDPATLNLVASLRKTYGPETVALLVPPGKEGDPVRALAPFTSGMRPLHGKPLAFVCQNRVCKEPTDDPVALEARLSKAP